MVPHPVRLPADMHARLKEISLEMDIPISSLIRTAIRCWLDIDRPLEKKRPVAANSTALPTPGVKRGSRKPAAINYR